MQFPHSVKCFSQTPLLQSNGPNLQLIRKYDELHFSINWAISISSFMDCQTSRKNLENHEKSWKTMKSNPKSKSLSWFSFSSCVVSRPFKQSHKNIRSLNWRQNLLVTILRCWWIFMTNISFIVSCRALNFLRCHQQLNFVTNMSAQHHKPTNVTCSYSKHKICEAVFLPIKVFYKWIVYSFVKFLLRMSRIQAN